MVGIAGAMAGFPALDPIAGGLVGLMIAKTGGETLLREISHCVE
jgi:divalent metal cation (Fe/Co/Zn/Cd) transporter